MYCKLLHKKTGLFANGGMHPSFSKTGNLWTSERNLKSHLRLVQRIYDLSKCYADCEIIFYQLVDVESEDITKFLEGDTGEEYFLE